MGSIKHGGWLGGRPTREYTIWSMMKQRCLNPKAVGYDRYGGIGVKICEAWMDFSTFRRDMGLAPSPKHSLDRINTNGNYEPGNCRWATKKEQGRNRRDSVRLEFRGETKTMSEWCEILGIRYDLVQKRLQYGWPVEEALTLAASPKRRSRR